MNDFIKSLFINEKLSPKRATLSYFENNNQLDLYRKIDDGRGCFSLAEYLKILYFRDGKLTCDSCDLVEVDKISRHFFPKMYCIACAKSIKLENTKQTNISLYGYAFNINSAKAKENSITKRKENNWQSKIEDSNIKKYGHKNVFSVDEVKNKIKKTNTERYGVEYPQQNKEMQEKSKNTVKEKTGFCHQFKDPAVIEKIKKTNLERYGVEIPTQNEAVKRKLSESAKRQKINSFTEKLLPETLSILNDEAALRNLYKENTVSSLSAMLGVSRTAVKRYFKTHNIEIERKEFSGEEKSFYDMLHNDDIKVIHNDRSVIKPKEIDIWYPDHNMGVEYHGLYWHSVTDTLVDKTHFEKYKLARENNISLLQFFSNEVKNKPSIVKNIVYSKLGINPKIYARKCVIREIDAKLYREFCDNNHLQGFGLAKIKIGLFHNDELVSVMSFGHSRFNKNVEYEMVRYCVKNGLSVVGGASKLWKYFIKTYNPKSVITFADARISNGDLYHTLGFEFKRHTAPNYFYTKDFDKLESRIKFQKHKLKDILDNFDPAKTEKENMVDNGYVIVYDAGNLVFEWENVNT